MSIETATPMKDWLFPSAFPQTLSLQFRPITRHVGSNACAIAESNGSDQFGVALAEPIVGSPINRCPPSPAPVSCLSARLLLRRLLALTFRRPSGRAQRRCAAMAFELQYEKHGPRNGVKGSGNSAGRISIMSLSQVLPASSVAKPRRPIWIHPPPTQTHQGTASSWRAMSRSSPALPGSSNTS